MFVSKTTRSVSGSGRPGLRHRLPSAPLYFGPAWHRNAETRDTLPPALLLIDGDRPELSLNVEILSHRSSTGLLWAKITELARSNKLMARRRIMESLQTG
jgi:hypothetical protein